MMSKLYDKKTIQQAKTFLNERAKYPEDKWDLPPFLYRYTKLFDYIHRDKSRDIVDDLKENIFSVTTPSLFNDIYDSKMHSDSYPQIERSLRYIEKMHGYTFPIKMKEHIKKTIEEDDYERMKTLSDPLRIMCFSSIYNSTPMWGMYADSNRGICIEYKSTEWDEEKNGIFPVIYSDVPIDIAVYNDKQSRSYDIALALLLSTINKYSAWSFESEWRLILNVYHSENKLSERLQCNYAPIPKSVILGRAFSKNLDNEKRTIAVKLLRWLFKANIDTFSVDYRSGTFELEKKPIDWTSDKYKDFIEN